MQKSKVNFIGISGVGTSGKDTLYSILEEVFKKNNITTDRLALADPLKAEINDFTTKQYGISAYTKDPKEKELIRPLMVIHGKIRRQMSAGKYFTSIAQKRLDENIKDNLLTICTDIRYSYYSTDEIHWLKSNNGLLIHIERADYDGQLVQPANNDELENDPKIKAAADYHLKWVTTNDNNLRTEYVKVQLNSLIEKIIHEKT